ncbi:MAG: glycosyltransferase [Gemmatimonadales bacterium]|nr:glycosyltransferase [Gemmatimonadales bacterium]
MTLAALLTTVYTVFGGILAVNAVYLRRSRRTGTHLSGPLPSVSVLVPARNEEENLQRLLPSLLAQDYPHFDIVVYDDGSTDGTWNVLGTFTDPRLRRLRGDEVPPGWVGKVHALYQASRRATGDLLLFVDADVVFKDAGALHRLVRRFQSLPAPAALTGITHLTGGGRLLVSLVPFVIFTCLPLPLTSRSRVARLSGMNGQCWMIARETYAHLEPHAAHRADVLEDIRIGRYLKAHDVIPHSVDLQDEVGVRMYGSFAEAWVGFRKNVFPFMGETVWSFALLHTTYLGLFVLAPLVSPWFVLAWYLLKFGSDRLVRMPLLVTAAAPISLVLGAVLQLDSAIAHWTGRARWKGRTVVRRVVESAGGPAAA